MKVYLVGGAVRDMIMGKKAHDLDYVVVGSTHQEMIDNGYDQVGADFPMYLHPKTKEEYALARQERKTGPGYHGFETRFDPSVTIEEDLVRRDLTINAIAQNMETGKLIDPYGGVEDIENKILRATSEAFEEDPLRILRLFRFRAQFGDEWIVDQATREMITKNIDKLKEIPVERQWKEFEKALKGKNPELFIMEMTEYGLLPELAAMRHFPAGPVEHHPEGDALTHTILCVKAAVKNELSSEVVFAMMCHDLGKAICWNTYGTLHGHEEAGVPVVEALCDRFKVPNSYRKLALTVTRYHGKIHGILKSKPKKVYDLVNKLGGARERAFFANVIDAANMDAWGRGPTKYGVHYIQGHFMQEMAFALEFHSREIKLFSREVAEKYKGRPEIISEQIRNKKIDIIRQAVREWRHKLEAGEIKP